MSPDPSQAGQFCNLRLNHGVSAVRQPLKGRRAIPARRHCGNSEITFEMDASGKILQTRFLLNMSRIHGLLRITRLDHDELKPKSIFHSEGISADILRSAVVFLHATFEDVVRSRIPRRKQDKKWVFY
jgi:hypothetical protein